MSFFSSMFGGSSTASKKELPKKAIADMRVQIEMLQKKAKHLESQIEEQNAIARKNVTTNKNLAKSALKRKKMHENNLEKISGQIDSLENNLLAIESANLNYETMKAMQQGAKAMKHIHGNMNIDKVDQTMDEIEEQITLGQEISNAISRPMGNEVDEDELLDELEQLEQETLEEKMVSVGKAPTGKLPSVSEAAKSKPIAQEEDDEEEELRKLQAEMAL